MDATNRAGVARLAPEIGDALHQPVPPGPREVAAWRLTRDGPVRRACRVVGGPGDISCDCPDQQFH
jgi:hypothetical protein